MARRPDRCCHLRQQGQAVVDCTHRVAKRNPIKEDLANCKRSLDHASPANDSSPTASTIYEENFPISYSTSRSAEASYFDTGECGSCRGIVWCGLCRNAARCASMQSGPPMTTGDMDATSSLPNDVSECHLLLLAAFDEATLLENHVVEYQQQVAELNRVLRETAVAYQELRQEHATTLDQLAWYKRRAYDVSGRDFSWGMSDLLLLLIPAVLLNVLVVLFLRIVSKLCG